MKNYVLCASLILSLPTLSFADCAKGEKIVFACTTTKNKKVEVCDAGKMINYAFGKAGVKPELALNLPRGEASTTQWEGIGSFMSYAVNIPNGKTVYNVFWGVSKMMEGDTKEPEVEAGVNVEINNKLVTTVKCDPKKLITQNIEGIDLKSAQ